MPFAGGCLHLILVSAGVQRPSPPTSTGNNSEGLYSSRAPSRIRPFANLHYGSMPSFAQPCPHPLTGVVTEHTPPKQPTYKFSTQNLCLGMSSDLDQVEVSFKSYHIYLWLLFFVLHGVSPHLGKGFS